MSAPREEEARDRHDPSHGDPLARPVQHLASPDRERLAVLEEHREAGERAVFQSVAEWKRMLADRRMTFLANRRRLLAVIATADASDRHQYASTIRPLNRSNAANRRR